MYIIWLKYWPWLVSIKYGTIITGALGTFWMFSEPHREGSRTTSLEYEVCLSENIIYNRSLEGKQKSLALIDFPRPNFHDFGASPITRLKPRQTMPLLCEAEVTSSSCDLMRSSDDWGVRTSKTFRGKLLESWGNMDPKKRRLLIMFINFETALDTRWQIYITWHEICIIIYIPVLTTWGLGQRMCFVDVRHLSLKLYPVPLSTGGSPPKSTAFEGLAACEAHQGGCEPSNRHQSTNSHGDAMKLLPDWVQIWPGTCVEINHLGDETLTLPGKYSCTVGLLPFSRSPYTIMFRPFYHGPWCSWAVSNALLTKILLDWLASPTGLSS